MRSLNSAIIGVAAAAVLFAAPASAGPLGSATSSAAIQVHTGVAGPGDVIKVQSRAERREERRARRAERRTNRAERRANRRENRAERRAERRKLRGHRGYRERRRGYRRHSDGWWYPLAAFGALSVGAAIANSADRSDRHEEWCEDRYRSYRAWDNTFQPYNGPRKQCNSPYG